MRLGQAVASPEEVLSVFHLQEFREFQELNELGMSPPPVCLKCQGCRDYTFRRKRLSPEDQDVVMRVEREMSVDSVTGRITAAYPWKNCVKRMMDNRRQAQKVQESMERHMIDSGTHEDYVKEMEKSLAEGKVRRLSQQEMADWHGLEHYITTFAVVKPESLSTKTRVVANSAMRNARARLSLNQCMWPGPNALTDLLDCLIFWRAVQVALMTDLKKAYQSIYTGEMELHLRKFLYRRDPRDPWEDLAFTRATFGDVAAGLVLEVAKRRVAELGQDIDPVAAQQLADYSYVDDNLMGVSREDVERMRGTRVDGEYTRTVPQILAKGAMQVKFMAVSGSSDQWETEQLAGKTLGVLYRLEEDEIYFVLRPGYYGTKQRSSDQVREIVLLDGKQVDELGAGRRSFTRRQALSMVMGVYDPLGLISPALTQGKLPPPEAVQRGRQQRVGRRYRPGRQEEVGGVVPRPADTGRGQLSPLDKARRRRGSASLGGVWRLQCGRFCVLSCMSCGPTPRESTTQGSSPASAGCRLSTGRRFPGASSRR